MCNYTGSANIFLHIVYRRKDLHSMENLRVTPLLGGNVEGAVCCLLEIGGARILLDCGSDVDSNFQSLLGISNDLLLGGGVDAVLIRYISIFH